MKVIIFMIVDMLFDLHNDKNRLRNTNVQCGLIRQTHLPYTNISFLTSSGTVIQLMAHLVIVLLSIGAR